MARDARKMVLNRNHVLETTLGAIIGFKKGVPVAVPYLVQAAALAIGAEFTDGAPAVEEVVDTGPIEPLPGSPERQAAILAAIERIVEKNVTEDFTAGGQPKGSALLREFGWNVSTAESRACWQAYHEQQALKKQNA